MEWNKRYARQDLKLKQETAKKKHGRTSHLQGSLTGIPTLTGTKIGWEDGGQDGGMTRNMRVKALVAVGCDLNLVWVLKQGIGVDLISLWTLK